MSESPQSGGPEIDSEDDGRGRKRGVIISAKPTIQKRKGRVAEAQDLNRFPVQSGVAG